MSEDVEVLEVGTTWTIEFPDRVEDVTVSSRDELVARIREIARELGYRKIKATFNESEHKVRVVPIEEAG